MNRTASTPTDRLAGIRQRIAAASRRGQAGPAIRRTAGEDFGGDKAPPFTKEDGGKDDEEKKEARRRAMRAMLRRRAIGDPQDEARLDTGNTDELASPSTRSVADEGDRQRAERLVMDSMGASAPVVTEVLSNRNPGRFAHVVIETLRRRMAALEARNKAMTAQAIGFRRRDRQAKSDRLAGMMLAKGMFRSAGSVSNQRNAARSEAARLAGLPDQAFQEATRLITAAPSTTAIPEWRRNVPTSAREGAVRAPVTAAATSGNGDGELESMFDRGSR